MQRGPSTACRDPWLTRLQIDLTYNTDSTTAHIPTIPYSNPIMSQIRLNIATKVFALAGAFLTLAAVIAFLPHYPGQQRARQFKTALAEPEPRSRRAGHVQVQVQEWKNVLLRGATQEGFEKYSTSFLKTEKEVLELATHCRSKRRIP
jgi:hypothetical protein